MLDIDTHSDPHPLRAKLYNHAGDDGFDFDGFENENCNASEPRAAVALRALLHEAVANASSKARWELVQ